MDYARIMSRVRGAKGRRPVPAGPGPGGERRFTEDELVSAVRRVLGGEAPGVVLGVGDDAALVEADGRLGILTTDMLLEGVHFDRSTISARDLGAKAVTVNVSDVAAMGGSPRYALVAVAVPAEVGLAWVIELYGGIRDAGAEYAVSVVGGDTNRSDRVVVSVMVTGEVPRGRAVTRAGARPGDRVAVTGALGASAGGLRVARAAAGDPSILSAGWARDLLSAHVRPVARVGEGQTLAQAGATAMIDLSDGLSTDLGRVCAASGVRAIVRLDAVPVAPGLDDLRSALGPDPLDLAVHGGEDYELLATLPPGAVDAVADLLSTRFGTALTVGGEVGVGAGVVAIDPGGAERPLEPKGWDHFAG